MNLDVFSLGSEQSKCFYLKPIKHMFSCTSIEHTDVLSDKINFSAPGGPKSAKFDPGNLDPIYFEVGNYSASPDLPYMSKNAQMC